MSRPTRERAFDAGALIAAVEDTREHLRGRQKVAFKVTRLPAAAREISSAEILVLRESLELTQIAFARLLNVPPATARSWERGVRSPSGAALRLLQIVGANPKVVAAL